MTEAGSGPGPKKSKAQFDYEDEQQRLQARMSARRGKSIVLDADSSWSPWLIVAIKAPTEILYETQCAGTGCDHRLVEGFLVPISGFWLKHDEGEITVDPFTDIFHEGNACVWSWTGSRLPQDRLERLQNLVENVPYWQCSGPGGDQRLSLKLDQTHLFEVAEGWIPVVTPDGPGVLLFKNCD
jgi:hypothetical protein